MNLFTCNVNVNPFIPHPATPRSRSSPTRLGVSEIRLRRSAVPSLQEYCFRVLFQPYSDGDELTGESNLQAIYGSPLEPRWRLSDPTREVMVACDATYVSAHKKARIEHQPFAGDHVRESPMGLSVCPAQRHSHGSKPIFVDHIEERFTWETRIGGKEVLGPPVPILWRGCSWRCLSFLDSEDEADENDNTSEGDNDGGVNLVSFDNGQSLAFSDDEGMEL
jgi:hypothetical protein